MHVVAFFGRVYLHKLLYLVLTILYKDYMMSSGAGRFFCVVFLLFVLLFAFELF
jgi:hypothetical protein